MTVPGIEETVRKKLQEAPGPLKLSEVVKGLPKPKKSKKGPPVPDLTEEARKILDEEVRLGRAFSYPSGKKEEVRYWAKDEKHLLREKTREFASTPQSIASLKKQLATAVKGADGAFVEAVIREMIGSDVLFQHPEQKKGTPLFGTSPPPPPPPVLEQVKHQKAVTKLVGDCKKLLAAAGASLDELFRVLQARLSGTPAANSQAESHVPAGTVRLEEVETPIASDAASMGPSDDLKSLILKAVSTAPVLSIADLRKEMPKEYQGRNFDAAVLSLADDGKVILSQDVNPVRFGEAERAEYVQDGETLLTTIAKWS
jgi:hypothetical protein